MCERITFPDNIEIMSIAALKRKVEIVKPEHYDLTFGDDQCLCSVDIEAVLDDNNLPWHKDPIDLSYIVEWNQTMSNDLATEVDRLKAMNFELIKALQFYADPYSYHAIFIMGDPPCGGFADDVSEEPEFELDFDRPMHGAKARAALDTTDADLIIRVNVIEALIHMVEWRKYTPIDDELIATYIAAYRGEKVMEE